MGWKCWLRLALVPDGAALPSAASLLHCAVSCPGAAYRMIVNTRIGGSNKTGPWNGTVSQESTQGTIPLAHTGSGLWMQAQRLLSCMILQLMDPGLQPSGME